MKRNIELNIEKLVLQGFQPGDRYRIGEALELELTRLLEGQSLPPVLLRNTEAAHLDGGVINVSSNKPERTGRQIARAVFLRLSR